MLNVLPLVYHTHTRTVSPFASSLLLVVLYFAFLHDHSFNMTMQIDELLFDPELIPASVQDSVGSDILVSTPTTHYFSEMLTIPSDQAPRCD